MCVSVSVSVSVSFRMFVCVLDSPPFSPSAFSLFPMAVTSLCVPLFPCVALFARCVCVCVCVCIALHCSFCCSMYMNNMGNTKKRNEEETKRKEK